MDQRQSCAARCVWDKTQSASVILSCVNSIINYRIVSGFGIYLDTAPDSQNSSNHSMFIAVILTVYKFDIRGKSFVDYRITKNNTSFAIALNFWTHFFLNHFWC
jgi:hypothetical protein